MSNPAGNPLKKLKTVINDLNDVTIKVEVVIIAPAFDTELTASISPGHSRTFNLSGLGSALNFYDLPGGEPVNVPTNEENEIFYASQVRDRARN